MTLQIKKGLKPFFIKYMALLMGICYLATPFHKQIASVFHEISHLIEAPENIPGHPGPVAGANNHAEEWQSHTLVSGNDHGHDDDYRVLASDDHGHGEEHHVLASDDHEHGILAVIVSIFDASEEHGTPDDSVPVPTKFDKHLASQKYDLNIPQPLLTRGEIASSDFPFRSRFRSAPFRPPR